ncbi:MAG: thioredoxin domain-containing protein [Chloroflexi bacterium]|nr:thioredoxin domain-containing protein [Chloroflexota bacterium]
MFRFSPRPNRAHLVRWRAWGQEAFEEAQRQDKPVALFITAFWCGFCQRMDEGSLSNDEVITLLNAFFVPIRVEESQRPDVDIRYNQDGWPTIVFLTPGGDHLATVNYMAPEAFINLLVRVVRSYQEDRAALLASVAQSAAPSGETATSHESAPLSPEIVAEIAGMVEGLADPVHGGYGVGAKFFHTEANGFLLYLFETTGERGYLEHVRLTLDTMRRSRTFDEQEGGFFRYSSKQDWQEPHPEKLLDDQAALLRCYLHAYLLTEEPRYRETAEGLVDYLDATLWDATKGVFLGCQDYVRQPPAAQDAGSPAGPGPLLSYLDSYVYCDANARAASALLDAWWLLGKEECRERAGGILEWLWQRLRSPEGGMCHYHDGQAQAPGLLTDSVMMGLALLDAFAVLGDGQHLERALELAAYVLDKHGNPKGGFFDIAEAGPARLSFPLTMLTQNATAATFFLRLADLSGQQEYRDWARCALQSFPNAHREYGAYAAGYGHALARLLTPALSVTVTGTPGDAEARRLAREALTQSGHPNVVLWFRASRELSEARVEMGDEGG